MKTNIMLNVSKDAYLLCRLCNVDMEKLLQYFVNHIDIKNGENTEDEHVKWASYFFVVYINKEFIEKSNQYDGKVIPLDKKS